MRKTFFHKLVQTTRNSRDVLQKANLQKDVVLPDNRQKNGHCIVTDTIVIGEECICSITLLDGNNATGINVENAICGNVLTIGDKCSYSIDNMGNYILSSSSASTSSASTSSTENLVLPTGWGVSGN